MVVLCGMPTIQYSAKKHRTICSRSSIVFARVRHIRAGSQHIVIHVLNVNIFSSFHAILWENSDNEQKSRKNRDYGWSGSRMKTRNSNKHAANSSSVGYNKCVHNVLKCANGIPAYSALARNHNRTSGYATWFTAGGAIRIAHYDVIDDVITRKL